jgi:4-hydroxy-4-methyl-2-oxoglutarate aldolase
VGSGAFEFGLFFGSMSSELFWNAAETVAALTPRNPFDRLADGRPRVPDELLDRLTLVTNDEAWAVLERHHEYPHQFEGNWFNLHPEQVTVGRAVTAMFVPKRPDLDEVVNEAGRERGPAGKQNTWLIDSLGERDVLVVDLFGKVRDGTMIGDNLGTAIRARTLSGGLVVDGGVRDVVRLRELDGIGVFARGADPSAIADVTLASVNGPVRIGRATVMPGDAVLATVVGVTFIPPHLVREVVEHSEDTRLRDRFGKRMLADGVYTTGDIDVSTWREDIEAHYQRWRTDPANTPR